MADDRLPDFPTHRPYENSYEQKNGLPPVSEQNWTSTDINAGAHGRVSKRDFFAKSLSGSMSPSFGDTAQVSSASGVLGIGTSRPILRCIDAVYEVWSAL